MSLEVINEAFRLSYAGAALEEEALHGTEGTNTADARRRAADNYAQAVDLLVQEQRKTRGSTARAIVDMARFLVERLEMVSGKQHPMPRMKDAIKDAKRHRAAQELLETEKTYLNGLRTMVDYYYVPMQRGNILNEEESIVVFASCTQILGLTEQIVEALISRLEIWDADTTTLGDVLFSFSDFLKMYIPFANSFANGQTILQQKSFDHITNQAASHGVPTLDALRITPIQRIPRYLLLIQELIKQTTDDHPDKELLQQAYDKIKLIAQETNARMHGSEMQAKVLEVQNSLWTATGGIPELVQPGRFLIKEGPVSKVRQGGTLKRNYYIFCFNDILVYATTNPLMRSKFHFHRALDYYGAFPADQEVKQLGITLRYGEAAFKITGSNGYRIFVASSDAERKDWLRALTESAEVKERKRRSWGKARGELVDYEEEGFESDDD